MGICQLGRRTTIIKSAFRPLATMNRMTRFVGGIEPLWSGGPTKWHHSGGVVSCGDSAGLVDPMTGEGLSAAFRNGEMAAQAVADYLGGHGEMSLVKY
jgi:flavin-dependent dehydrogenase